MSNNLSDRAGSANLINPNSARVRPLKEGVACVGAVVGSLVRASFHCPQNLPGRDKGTRGTADPCGGSSVALVSLLCFVVCCVVASERHLSLVSVPRNFLHLENRGLPCVCFVKQLGPSFSLVWGTPI